MKQQIEYIRFEPSQDGSFLPGLINCYRRVFAGEPWNEWKKCQVCQKKWGIQEKDKLRDINFIHCNKPVIDFWPKKVVRNDILQEIIPSSSCWLVLDGDRVVGFTWGYPISIESLEKKLKLPGLAATTRQEFGDLDLVAYQDEIGMLKDYRGQKKGRQLFIRWINDCQHQNLPVVISRTKANPPTVTYYWYRRLGYKVIAHYNDSDQRVILARTLIDFHPY